MQRLDWDSCHGELGDSPDAMLCRR